jgi:hypothetical protein
MRRLPRRDPYGGAASSSGAGAVSITVVAQLSSTNYFSTTAATRPALSTTATIAVVLRRITGVNIVREYRIERYTSATRGFRFMPIHDGAASRATATIVSGAPANVSEQNTYTPTQNEFQVIVLRRDTTVVEVYRSGALMSAGAAIAGYTAPAAEAFVLQGNGAMSDEVEIASISISDSTALSAGQISTYYDTVKANGSRVIPSATHHWEASDIGGGAWVDQIAGVSWTQNGSPITRVITSPVYT